jgi:catechol 2,3-dioxygenase-like lactoylglutathione lyase family enzyme
MADAAGVSVLALDHVNIRTARLGELVAFYSSVLGLVIGPRPPFTFPGAWLYVGNRPVLHLVEVTAAEAPPETEAERLRLSHFAFRATGLDALLSRLGGANVGYHTMPLPGTAVTQVHFADPDGNMLHVDVDEDSH